MGKGGVKNPPYLGQFSDEIEKIEYHSRTESKGQTCREAGTQSDRVCSADSLAAEEINLGSFLVNQAV